MLRNITKPRSFRFVRVLPVLILFSVTSSRITPTTAQDSTPDGLRGIALASVAPDAPLVELPAADGTELARNGGFENAPAKNNKNAKQWTWAGNRSGGDRRICNTATNTNIAFSGQCALQFSSSAGLPRSIYQKRTFSPALGATNDKLALSLVASTKNLSKNVAVKLKVKYKGGGNHTFKLQIPAASGEQPYAAFSKQFKLSAPVQTLELRIASAAKGRIRIDALSLIHLPETPPQFVSSVPADGEQDVALGTNSISMTFDEPVHVEVGWYDLNCIPNTGAIGIGVSGDGTDTLTLTSDKEFAVGDICEVTIHGDFISDADADDPPDTMEEEFVFFSFQMMAEPPQPVNDSYNVSPNIGLTVPAASGYLANDTLVRGVVTSPALNTPITTTQGGKVTLLIDGSGKATGAFNYEPPLGKHSTADTFNYTLQNAIGQSSSTVSLNLMAQPSVWFINGAAPQNGNGALSSPFIDITSYNTFAGSGSTVRSGDIVFLYSGTYTGPGLILKNGQAVYGQSVDLSAIMTWLPLHSNPLPGVSTRPVISTLIGAGVLLGQNNTLRGFNIGDTANYAISGSLVGALTISDMAITTTNGALNIATGGPLNIQFDSVTAIGTAIAPAVNLMNTSGTLYIADGFLSGLNGDMFVVSGGTPTITYEGDMTTVGNGWLLRVENTTDGEITLRNGTLSAVAHGVKATNAAHVRLRDLTLQRINPIIDEFMRLLTDRYGLGNFALDEIARESQTMNLDAPMADEANGVQVENSQLTLRDMTVNDFAANGVSAANGVLTLVNADLLDNDLSALLITSQGGNTALDMTDSTVFTTSGAGVTITAGDNGAVCAHFGNNTINGSGGGWGLWLETMAATAKIALRDYAGDMNHAGQITTFIQAANGVTPSTNVLPTLGNIGNDPTCNSGG